jgi:CBS domain-containing protein
MSAPGSQSSVVPDERPALGETGNDPLVLLELIQRLKVRDVMTSDLVTLPRAASMQQAQELMRQKRSAACRLRRRPFLRPGQH